MGGEVVLKFLHTGDTKSWDQLLVDKGRGGGPQTWIGKRGEGWYKKKSPIRKTLNLLTDADSSIGTIIKLKNKPAVKGFIS